MSGWRLCNDAGPFDFRDQCVRSFWSALLPATFVFLLCLSSLPLPSQITKLCTILKSPFQSYLNLHEAEALDVNLAVSDKVTAEQDRAVVDSGKLEVEVPDTVPLWRTVVFAFVGLVEALSWLTYGSYHLISHPSNFQVWDAICPFLIALSWLYTVVRPVVRPTATPPFDLFAVYCLQLVTGVLQLGGVLFEYGVIGGSAPLLVTLALSANLAAILVLLVVVVNIPLAIPSNRVEKGDIVSFIFIFSILVRSRQRCSVVVPLRDELSTLVSNSMS